VCVQKSVSVTFLFAYWSR